MRYQIGSVQWLADEVMDGKYIKGDKTLYAVYSNKAPLLGSQANIGDYVKYPVGYANVDTSGEISTYTGWRILNISKDGKAVTLVSAGTPLLSNSSKLSKIKNNFLDNEHYIESGIEEGDLETIFSNIYTKDIQMMSKQDIDKIRKKSTKIGDNISKYGSLLDNNSSYWIGDTNVVNPAIINGYTNCVEQGTDETYGVRPKVILVDEIKTSGRNVSGVWELLVQ